MSLLEQMTVDTLRVRGADDDTPALRTGLSNLLQGTDLQPPSLPPAAILLVHHLAQPEKHLALRRSTLQPDTEWIQAVRTELAALARRAARPQQGRLPPEAEAILFTDEAELLACLALDLRWNQVHQRWWWRAILRLLGDVSLPALLHSQVQLVPAVVTHLADWRCAADLLATVPVDAARLILTQMLRAHQVSWTPFASVVIGDRSPSALVVSDSADRPAGDDPPQVTDASLSAVESSPGTNLAAWAGELDLEQWPALVPQQIGLLAMSLLLYREPVRVRSHGFGRSFNRWWRESQTGNGGGFPRLRQTSSGIRDGGAGIGNREWGTGDWGSGAGEQGAGSSDQSRLPTERANRQIPVASRQLSVPDPQPPIPSPQCPAPDPQSQIADHPSSSNEDATETGGAVDLKADSATPVPLPEPLTTEWGGVLYLINLCEHLDLPLAFQPDWQLADHLGPWDLLAVVGRALLDALDGSEWQDDPLWALLAQLGGRETGETPGGDLPVTDFRLPPSWVQTVGHINWRAENGRLTLWTDDPFLLVDCTETGDAAAQATREAARYDAGSTLVEASDHALLSSFRHEWFDGCGPGLRRWLACTLPYLRVWLQRTLALPSSDPHLLAETLLHRRARIHVTRTHVDLVLSLEQIALPVRLAGLDRSPGWLPQAGRVVTFHFQ